MDEQEENMSRILEIIIEKLSYEPQPFGYEITTKIPRENLLYIICNFYWNMGHKSIMFTENPEVHQSYMYYNPTLEIENAGKNKKISVSTHKKKENKQKFDSVVVNFEKEGIGKTKINWRVAFGYKDWQFIYFIVAFFIGLHYAGKPYISGFMGTLITIALIIPVFYWIFYRIKKLENHPSIERYKKEFKEMIRQKEREMFPDDY
mgnify:CR=1 FL=1